MEGIRWDKGTNKSTIIEVNETFLFQLNSKFRYKQDSDFGISL